MRDEEFSAVQDTTLHYKETRLIKLSKSTETGRTNILEIEGTQI